MHFQARSYKDSDNWDQPQRVTINNIPDGCWAAAGDSKEGAW